MKTKNNTMVLILFLLGIFLGALDSGIVSPAREIIQNGFGVTKSLGTWMLTIYTLSYAISMPIVSKMAERYGHKKIYIIGILLFGIGSLLCGLSNIFGSFTFFLVSRVIQAIGAGGIIPIATSVIGQSFPDEKRGAALGLVGAIYGIAVILGPTAGSSILSLAGNNNWGWIFLINIPISLLIIGLSYTIEEIITSDSRLPLDFAGAAVIAGVIGTLMYALTNLNFFKFAASIKNPNVYIYLIAFVILLPILVWVESRAKDPILNIKYFKNRQLVVIFILSLIVGIGMMGMVFVPQFAENILKIKAGTGGYLVTLLAVFSGISAPISGRIIDKKGARFVMTLGFLFTIVGTLFLGYFATKRLDFISLLIGLAFMGFGVGFNMGPPLNYLVMKAVDKHENTSALATMSLIRSIGITISPSIMIGFIVEAAKKLQVNIMSVMPQGMPMSQNMGNDPKAMELFKSLQNYDVTTIVDGLKNVLQQLIPAMGGKKMLIESIEKMRQQIEATFQSTMNTGYTNMFTAAAIISLIGLVFTFLLKTDKNTSI